jgi:hypothetical protein
VRLVSLRNTDPECPAAGEHIGVRVDGEQFLVKDDLVWDLLARSPVITADG